MSKPFSLLILLASCIATPLSYRLAIDSRWWGDIQAGIFAMPRDSVGDAAMIIYASYVALAAMFGAFWCVGLCAVTRYSPLWVAVLLACSVFLGVEYEQLISLVFFGGPGGFLIEHLIQVSAFFAAGWAVGALSTRIRNRSAA